MVQQRINDVVSSCKLGQQLLGHAKLQLSLGEMAETVNQHAALVTGKLNAERLGEWEAAFQTAVAEAGVSSTTKFEEREVMLSYRDIRFPVTVTSIGEHYRLAVFARVVGLAVDAQLMDPMWCENGLVGLRPPVPEDFEVEDAVLRLAKPCRKVCTDALDDARATPTTIQETLNAKKKNGAWRTTPIGRFITASGCLCLDQKPKLEWRTQSRRRWTR